MSLRRKFIATKRRFIEKKIVKKRKGDAPVESVRKEFERVEELIANLNMLGALTKRLMDATKNLYKIRVALAREVSFLYSFKPNGAVSEHEALGKQVLASMEHSNLHRKRVFHRVLYDGVLLLLSKVCAQDMPRMKRTMKVRSDTMLDLDSFKRRFPAMSEGPDKERMKVKIARAERQLHQLDKETTADFYSLKRDQIFRVPLAVLLLAQADLAAVTLRDLNISAGMLNPDDVVIARRKIKEATPPPPPGREDEEPEAVPDVLTAGIVASHDDVAEDVHAAPRKPAASSTARTDLFGDDTAGAPPVPPPPPSKSLTGGKKSRKSKKGSKKRKKKKKKEADRPPPSAVSIAAAEAASFGFLPDSDDEGDAPLAAPVASKKTSSSKKAAAAAAAVEEVVAAEEEEEEEEVVEVEEEEEEAAPVLFDAGPAEEADDGDVIVDGDVTLDIGAAEEEDDDEEVEVVEEEVEEVEVFVEVRVDDDGNEYEVMVDADGNEVDVEYEEVEVSDEEDD